MTWKRIGSLVSLFLNTPACREQQISNPRMQSSLAKGNALEAAVRAIETAILHSSPALRENTFRIESKKRVVVGGVRHEIDVYVEVDMGEGYKAIFIFECKNWEEVVGKNEIIVFSEKIDALQAQKGFFVAKSFSSDARAQADKDPRVQMVIATEHNAADTPAPFDFHTIVLDKSETTAEVELTERGASSDSQKMQFANANDVIYKGAKILLGQFANEWIDNVVNENLSHFPSSNHAEGLYELSAEQERVFEDGELMVVGKGMAKAKLKVKFSVRVVRPAVVSHFEVTTRGRSIFFAPVQVGTSTLETTMVLRPLI